MDDIVLQFRTQPLLGYRLATATAAALAIFMDWCSDCAALRNIGAATGKYKGQYRSLQIRRSSI
jgi:hypothetical protein